MSVYLYGFKKQFAPDVESGKKRCTIRRRGKRPPPLPGMTLRLAEGIRTKHYRRLRDVVCHCVQDLDIYPTYVRLQNRRVSDQQLLAIAKKDGFADLKCFRDFFLSKKERVFYGHLIEWRLE